MKQLVTIVAAVLISSYSFAQTNSYLEVMRGALKMEKKAMVAEAMQLSEEEAKVFWPLYNEFDQKLYELDTKVFNLIIDFANNFQEMPAEKASELMNSALNLDLQKSKLKKSYYKKFAKSLPPQKALRYYQVENKIHVLIDA